MFICFYSKPEALSNTVYLNNINVFWNAFQIRTDWVFMVCDTAHG